MTSEQRAQIQAAIRETPKSMWVYLPFLLPLIILVVGIGVQIALVLYLKSSKVPDLEVLFKHGNQVDPVWDSECVRQAVLVTSASIVVTFFLFVYFGRLAFKYASLLKAVAKDVGIDESP